MTLMMWKKLRLLMILCSHLLVQNTQSLGQMKSSITSIFDYRLYFFYDFIFTSFFFKYFCHCCCVRSLVLSSVSFSGLGTTPGQDEPSLLYFPPFNPISSEAVVLVLIEKIRNKWCRPTAEITFFACAFGWTREHQLNFSC